MNCRLVLSIDERLYMVLGKWKEERDQTKLGKSEAESRREWEGGKVMEVKGH